MKLSPDFVRKLSTEQMELLTELGDLAKKESQLTELIEMTRRQADKVGLGRDREKTRSLMDDPEFEYLLTVGAIKEKEMIKDKIKSILQSLISVGLGELDIVARQAANYGLIIEGNKNA
jgi:hypothetical protein